MAVLSKSLRAHLNYDSESLFRAQIGGVMLGPWPLAPIITSLVDPLNAGKIRVPDLYEGVGFLSTDGAEEDEDISTQEFRAWGSTGILRRDFESWDYALHFAMMADTRIAQDASMGLDTRNVPMISYGIPQGGQPADGITAERSITLPSRPAPKYWRAIRAAADHIDDPDLMVSRIRVFHKVTLTEKDTTTYGGGDDPVLRDVTFGADDDTSAGGPVTEILLGPGALARAEAMGIPVVAAA